MLESFFDKKFDVAVLSWLSRSFTGRAQQELVSTLSRGCQSWSMRKRCADYVAWTFLLSTAEKWALLRTLGSLSVAWTLERQRRSPTIVAFLLRTGSSSHVPPVPFHTNNQVRKQWRRACNLWFCPTHNMGGLRQPPTTHQHDVHSKPLSI